MFLIKGRPLAKTELCLRIQVTNSLAVDILVGVNFSTRVQIDFFAYFDERNEPSSIADILSVPTYVSPCISIVVNYEFTALFLLLRRT